MTSWLSKLSSLAPKSKSKSNASTNISFSNAERRSLLVCGYLRRNSIRSIPDGVARIISDLAANCFKWNTKTHGSGFAFDKSDATVVTKNTDVWAFLVAEETVSKTNLQNNSRSLFWELLIERKLRDTKAIDFQMGFVTVPISESLASWNNHCFGGPKHYSVMVHSINHHFRLFGRDGCQDLRSKIKYTFKQGDKIGLKFDFVTDICDLYYNGEFVRTIYENIPGEFVPAICVYYPIRLVCTAWG